MFCLDFIFIAGTYNCIRTHEYTTLHEYESTYSAGREIINKCFFRLFLNRSKKPNLNGKHAKLVNYSLDE